MHSANEAIDAALIIRRTSPILTRISPPSTTI